VFLKFCIFFWLLLVGLLVRSAPLIVMSPAYALVLQSVLYFINCGHCLYFIMSDLTYYKILTIMDASEGF